MTKPVDTTDLMHERDPVYPLLAENDEAWNEVDSFASIAEDLVENLLKEVKDNGESKQA